MEKFVVTMRRELIAEAMDRDEIDYVRLYGVDFDRDCLEFSTRHHFVLMRRVMDWSRGCWDKFFDDAKEAVEAFEKEAFDGRREYGKPETSYRYDEIKAWIANGGYDDEYTPSATGGDYSPSCPWNAPGMKVSDFI